MDEEILNMIKRAQSGDKEALIQLIMNQKQDYYHLAYIYMKNQEDTLDALEDMILRLYENIKGLKNEQAFFSWSKKILVNCCKHNLRKKNKVLLLKNIPERSYEDPFNDQGCCPELEEHLLKLSPKYQEVLKLRYYLDMDYETIATVLKIPLGTVKSRIHSGLQKLKRSMGVENG